MPRIGRKSRLHDQDFLRRQTREKWRPIGTIKLDPWLLRQTLKDPEDGRCALGQGLISKEMALAQQVSCV